MARSSNRLPRDLNVPNAPGTHLTHVHGVDKILALFSALERINEDKYKQFLEARAGMIMKDYTGRIKSVTGNLVRSTKIRKSYTDKRIMVSVVAGGRIAPHAHLVEFGHRQITKDGTIVGDVPPHPYMRDAFEKNARDIESRMLQILDDILKD